MKRARTKTTKFGLSVLLGAGLWACGAEVGGAGQNGDFGDDSPVVVDEATDASSAALRAGDSALTTADLNLRSGPSTNNRVLLTMPRGAAVDVLGQSGSWFSVRYRGTSGWAHGGYLADGGGTTTPTPPPSSGSGVEAAFTRARSGLGFSYYWGGGCWDPGSSSKGACYGSCPDCSHSGRWGADCSGYVTKVWQVPGPQELTDCDRGPYTTREYYANRTHWSQVSRGSARRGDAFVKRGHIFLYNAGDAWGSIDAYEAKGCSYGIVRNNRTADSSYIVIRRRGY
jgi:hypothetical protein